MSSEGWSLWISSRLIGGWCVRMGSEISWLCFLRMWETDRLHCEQIDRYVWSISVRLIHSIRLLEWLVLTSHWITNIHIKIILMQTFLLYIIQSFLIGSCHWCFLAMTRMFQTPCRACHHMGGASAHITNLSTTRWQQRLSTTCYDLQGEGHVNKPS